VKIVFTVGLLLAFIYPRSKHFNITDGNAREIVYASSFWLSGSPMIDPLSNNRLIIETGLSLITVNANPNNFKYPNIDVGMKVTKNLSLTYRSYGFESGDDHPQIIGGGLQYYFGGQDTLNWSTTFQRIDLKGLEYFSLSSLLIDLRKWFRWNKFKFRIGVGTNFFKEHSFSGDHDLPNTMKGQINFLGFDFAIPISVIILGVENRISPHRSISTFYIQKEIF